MNLIGDDLKFKSISKILQSYDENYFYLDNKENKDFNDIKNFINVDFLKFLENEFSVNAVKLINEFEKELDKFYMYMACRSLVSKTLIGIGGALNSGKSSFLNKLFSINILPSTITPSIAVPTYVVQNENVKISMLNIFNNIVEVNEEEIKNIYYEFEDTYNIPVSNILKNIFLQIPEQRYSNLAFLDTAGCGLLRKEDYNENNDYKFISEQLNSCNYILWFVDSESGTIKESDIEFLETLRKDIPILIIISRTDKKQSSDIEKIENQVRMKLKKTGIAVCDIIPYSSKNADIDSTNKIKEYLEKWNDTKMKCTIGKDFQFIFDKIEEHFHEKRKKETMNLNTINSLLINVKQFEEIQKLESIQQEIIYKINRLKEREKELKQLNIKFLSLLKKSAQAVGIDIYESLTDKTNGNLAKFIKQYKKENNIEDKNYKSLINIRLYYNGNEKFRNKSLFLSQHISMACKEIINKKLSHVHRGDVFMTKKRIIDAIEAFSNCNLKLEKKENTMLIKHKLKKINTKDIDWIKIKEI